MWGDGWTKHQPIVIAADKILSVFAGILSLQKNSIVFPLSKAFQKQFSYHSRDAITPFLPSPLRPNTFLTIPVTSKHVSCHPSYAKTLSLPSSTRQNTYFAIPTLPKYFISSLPQCQNICLAIPTAPQHFPCHSCSPQNTTQWCIILSQEVREKRPCFCCAAARVSPLRPCHFTRVIQNNDS